MSVTRSIYVLWLRELKREWREKSRIIASLMTPILWLFIFGTGIRVGKIEGVTDYRVFIFPGII
ncbi:MAG: daunorubicin ABC transporter permease, partial [Candidatus Wukongarchaeota archaeon]|nr:daunorubicin ABC transporter permease [Candidatus Wukongarchaeota archaeon]